MHEPAGARMRHGNVRPLRRAGGRNRRIRSGRSLALIAASIACFGLATGEMPRHHQSAERTASDRNPTELRSTLRLSGANDGQVFTGYRISTAAGDCVDIKGARNVTFRNSDIGPCGGRGIYIEGGSGNRIYDNYIHVEGAARRCCDTRDGILIRDSDFSAVQGNVVAYSESNIEVFANNVVIAGNFLLNPQGPYPRGQQIQTGAGTNVTIADNFLLSTRDATLGPAIGTASTAPILMSQGARSSPPEDSINIYTTQHVLVQGNYVTGGLDATSPNSGGAQSPSGCGILGADGDKRTGASHVTIRDNIVLNTGQCGIGIGTGTDQAVVGNRVLNLNPNSGGNSAIYVWKQYPPPCGPVLLSGNVASEIKPTGYGSGFWDGGGCAPVTCDGENTNVSSCNLFDYGPGRAAQRKLLADSAIRTAPAIPPRPRGCAAKSPYSNQKSFAPC